jgi:mono/diheme cytochrome c family protein
MRYGSLAAALAILLSDGRAALSSAPQTIEDRGLRIRNRACSRCHGIGRASPSGRPKAPPFREIATCDPLENLAEAFAEGIVSGHPDLPAVSLGPAGIGAIIAVLNMPRDPPKQP